MKMKKVVESTLINTIKYYCKVFKLKLPILIRKNRMKELGFVGKKANKICLVYNLKKFQKRHIFQMYHFIFHELGHIKTKFYSISSHIEREYRAEKFALKNLARYFPIWYILIVEQGRDSLSNSIWCRNNPIYVKAYSRLKEFNVRKNRNT